MHTNVYMYKPHTLVMFYFCLLSIYEKAFNLNQLSTPPHRLCGGIVQEYFVSIAYILVENCIMVCNLDTNLLTQVLWELILCTRTFTKLLSSFVFRKLTLVWFRILIRISLVYSTELRWIFCMCGFHIWKHNNEKHLGNRII